MKLHYRKYGTGKPLIILHGLFGSGLNWNNIGMRLAKHHTVYIVDQRNHGRSPHSNWFNYDHLSNDLLSFYRQQKIEKAILLGHSMGGKTAITFSFQNPEMVEKLIVVDIGINACPVKDENMLDAMLDLDLQKYDSRREVNKELSQSIAEEGLRLFIMQNLKREKDNTFTWRMNLRVLADNIEEVAKKVTIKGEFVSPTLFIVGDRSNYVLKEEEKKITKYFSDIQFASIANAGHWVHADNPVAFEREVTAFLGIH